jgi:hypothetical protein
MPARRLRDTLVARGTGSAPGPGPWCLGRAMRTSSSRRVQRLCRWDRALHRGAGVRRGRVWASGRSLVGGEGSSTRCPWTQRQCDALLPRAEPLLARAEPVGSCFPREHRRRREVSLTTKMTMTTKTTTMTMMTMSSHQSMLSFGVVVMVCLAPPRALAAATPRRRLLLLFPPPPPCEAQPRRCGNLLHGEA